MTRTFFISACFLGLFCAIPEAARAQTPTPTSTPNCCQGVSFISGYTAASGTAIHYGLGLVYLTDPGSHQVKVYNFSGIPVTAFGSAQLGDPMDVSVDTAGNVFIADLAQNAVFAFDSNYAPVTSFQNSYLGYPRGVYVDDSGVTESLYVAGVNSAVIRFDLIGGVGGVYSAGLTFQTIVGTPDELVKSGNYLYVTNTTGDEITQYDASNGTSITSYPVNSAYGLRKDLGGDFIVSTSTGPILQYSDWAASPATICSLPNFPWSAVVNPSGQVFVSEYNGGGVSVIQSCVTEPASTPTPPQYSGNNPPAPGSSFIYPSPARGDHATLCYSMAEGGQVDLKILNENGELAADITDRKPAGVQVTPFRLSPFSSGVYYYVVTLTYDSGRSERLKTGKFVVVR